MDAHSGQVLYSQNPDQQTFPASLTKIMTLYMVFEQLESGKLSTDSRIRMSKHAANQAPSRLGVKPGKSISVETAILALVTKSANDVASAIAEKIGGSESAFAVMMTQKARSLGMDRTQYKNASGLPNKGQLTTARDQARLAKRMQQDFPQYYHYFGKQSFAWEGNSIRNHNHLLGKYAGTNGIKTGYTAASGFNLTASVMRDGKSVIGVVLGGPTARDRDKKMVALLDKVMPSALALRDTGTRFADATPTAPSTSVSGAPVSGITEEDRNALAALANDEPDPDEESYVGPQVASLTAPTPASASEPAVTPVKPAATMMVASAPLPAPLRLSAADTVAIPVKKPSIPAVLPAPNPARQQVAALEKKDAKPASAQPTIERVKAYTVAALDKAEGPVTRVGREVGNLIVPPAHASEGGQSTQPIGMRTSVTESATLQRGWSASDPLIPNGTWIIQIGAYADQGDAVNRIRSAIKAAPKELGKAVPVTIPVQTADNRTLYRSRFGGFEDEKQARNACGRLVRESISCIAIPPAQWSSKEKQRG